MAHDKQQGAELGKLLAMRWEKGAKACKMFLGNFEEERGKILFLTFFASGPQLIKSAGGKKYTTELIWTGALESHLAKTNNSVDQVDRGDKPLSSSKTQKTFPKKGFWPSWVHLPPLVFGKRGKSGRQEDNARIEWELDRAGGWPPHHHLPPTEITNKAGEVSTAVLARDCCERSLYLQMADDPKIRLEFFSNFVCLLLQRAWLGAQALAPPQPNTFQYWFLFRQILNITEMLYFAPTCNAAADSL